MFDVLGVLNTFIFIYNLSLKLEYTVDRGHNINTLSKEVSS